MKRRAPIAKTVAIALILAFATAFASTAQAQPPVVSPPHVAPDYDPLAGITQTQRDEILNYILRALSGSRTLPDAGVSQDDTVALGGTSETFVDVQPDGSYYDPSLGRRVLVHDAR